GVLLGRPRGCAAWRMAAGAPGVLQVRPSSERLVEDGLTARERAGEMRSWPAGPGEADGLARAEVLDGTPLSPPWSMRFPKGLRPGARYSATSARVGRARPASHPRALPAPAP